MRSLSHAIVHNVAWMADEVVPREAAVVKDVIVGFEDPVREPFVAHELPNVFDRVDLGASRGKRHQGNSKRHDEFGRAMLTGLIEDDHAWAPSGTWMAISSGCILIASPLQRRITIRQPFLGRLYHAKAAGRGAPLIAWYRRAYAALVTAPRELGLRANPTLVLPRQYYGRSLGRLSGFTLDGQQTLSKNCDVLPILSAVTRTRRKHA